MSTPEPDLALFEAAGGQAGIETVVRAFYARVFDDLMIGYLFRRVDRERLILVETEFAARALGATSVRYTGRPLREAHAAHRIQGGQFDRRSTLLRETLLACGVSEPVRAAWLAHTEALRALITADGPSICQAADDP